MTETWKFPNGEIGVKMHITGRMFSDLYLEDCTSDSIIKLLLQADALKRGGIEISCIHIGYFPYSRQDRADYSGEALSVKVIADLINSIGAKRVTIIDPHSNVAAALVNNADIFHQYEFVRQIPDLDKYTLICPDAGQQKKMEKLKRPYIMCTKVRDTNTGEITETKVYNDEPLDGKNCLIVDDICDGGRTFIEIAKILKEKGAANIDLYVTHGFFTKGLDVFKGYINEIYHVEKGKLVCELIR